ncbi:MAG: hypothetical protein KC478_11855 [Bacteriovoracaceae bacterium]|nr:hypothetical protein [Bacteriovoracaceae bacterium]
MSDLIQEAMNKLYQDALRRLRKTSSNAPKGYVAELFPTDWDFREFEEPELSTPVQEASTPAPVTKQQDPPEKVVSTVTEKTKVLDSFHEFAHKEMQKLNESTLHFPGGEARKKASSELFANILATEMDVEQLKELNEQIHPELARLKFSLNPSTTLKVLFVAQDTIELGSLDQKELGLEAFFESSAAQLFNRMIGAMKLEEGDSFVSSLNIVKDSKEQSFEEGLCMEIYNLKPQVVIPLGGVATSVFLGGGLKLQNSHGQFFEREVKNAQGESFKFEVMPLFSPAFLVEAPNTKRAAWEDMQKVMKKLGL